jgi:D-xylose transport system substrate-binding protein
MTMSRSSRAAASSMLVGTIALALAGCSSNEPAGSGSGSGSGSAAKAAKVAFLMPDQGSTRYEEHDRPGFEAQMKKLCPDCTVLYNNADADAAKQQQQFNAAITEGAKAIVLDAVDTSAAASLVQQAQSQGIKVVAYDRPIPDTPADFYVSYDNEKIGQLISASLVKHMADKGVSADTGGVLQVNGSPTDAAAGLIKKGMHEGLATGDYKTLAEYDTPDWTPAKAQTWVSGQITRFGDKIVGVAAANDGTAGGSIAAFKAAGVDPVPAVSGNDAIDAALQYIISGDQYNTISKPSEVPAAAAADAVWAMLQGKAPEKTATLFDTPSKLFVPVVVTRENIKAEIFDKGIAKAATICTGEYAAGCKELGIS